MWRNEHENQKVWQIWFVCDAGMGSSALGAGLLQKKLKNAKIPARVRNCAIDELEPSADIFVSHPHFQSRIQKQYPAIRWVGVASFLQEEEYERIVNEIMLFTKKKEKKEILEKCNIHLNAHANTSDEAILAIGKVLKDAGYIKEGYIQGMLNRDHSLTTYIGNDIAIPHGEYEVKDCVLETGIAVMIYPEGIAWAQGTARIVIGIAAKNDDHMAILANIADKLGDMDVVEQVVAGDVDTIYTILKGEAS